MNILITESQVDKLIDEKIWANIEKGFGADYDWNKGELKKAKKFLIPLSMMTPNQTIDKKIGGDIHMDSDESKEAVSNIIKKIKNGGNISPILVHRIKGGFLIVDGHHRYQALKEMGKKYALSVIIPKENVKFIDKLPPI